MQCVTRIRCSTNSGSVSSSLGPKQHTHMHTHSQICVHTHTHRHIKELVKILWSGLKIIFYSGLVLIFLFVLLNVSYACLFYCTNIISKDYFLLGYPITLLKVHFKKSNPYW